MEKRKSLFSIVLAFIMLLFTLFFCFSVKPIVRNVAAENIQEYEQRNVMDDLKSSTLNGQAFSFESYPFTGKGKPSILSVIEYGYSPFEDRQDSFNLYVYIYNPAGTEFLYNSSLNSIGLKIGRLDSSEGYTKYPLSFLNMSTESDYLGLYWKFKVVFPNNERLIILNKLNSAERVYAVSEIELVSLDSGTIESYGVGREYIYKGYMQGMGPDLYAESTLSCSEDALETLSLDVHPTFFRPEGTNGKNDYTQDSLHSVYFAVPNDTLKKYGNLAKVHAMWLDAVLKPILITGHKESYDAIEKVLGDVRPELDYCYIGEYGEHVENSYYMCGHGVFCYPYDNISTNELTRVERELDVLYLLFYSGSSLNSAKNFVVTGEQILTELENKSIGAKDLIQGKYSRFLFDDVASEWTEKNIEAEYEYKPITSEVIGSSWWDKFWGNTTTTTFDGITALHEVKSSDFSGDSTQICQALYINHADYESFKKFYDINVDDHTIFLFRYQITDYVSQQATLFHHTDSWLNPYEEDGANAYFAQETVNLGFDIIDLTFRQGEQETVIPVVMTPQDIVPDITPPVNWEDDEPDWWKVLFPVLGAIILLIILWPFISPIVSVVLKMVFEGLWFAIKLIIKILVLPFKWLFDLLFKRK